MEIKIDTKKDSAEDIRKAIEFLQKFITQESETPVVTEGAFNLFGQDTPVSNILDDKEEDLGEKKADNDIEIKPIFY